MKKPILSVSTSVHAGRLDRLSFLFAIGFSLAFSLYAARPCHADESARARDIARILIEEYSLSLDGLSSAVTAWGANADPSVPRRLVRWPIGTIHLAIVKLGDVDREADSFARSMSETGALVGFKEDVCATQLEVAGTASYASQLRRTGCLKRRDVLVVIDGSPNPSTDLFEDLSQFALSPVETRFWERRATAPLAAFENTSCEAHLQVNQTSFRLGNGVAYFRIRTEGDVNIALLPRCMDLLPALILGQPPLRSSDNVPVYPKELLELIYSPELAPGMTQAQIENVLR